jgi:hypothetical protein
MGHNAHFDVLCGVVDFVDHPVIADADTPRPVFAAQFLATSGTRLIGKSANLFRDAGTDFGRETGDFLFGRAANEDLVRHAQRF